MGISQLQPLLTAIPASEHMGEAVLLAAATAIAIVIIRIKQQKHRKKLYRISQSLNLTYTPRDCCDIPSRFRQLTIIDQGHDRIATDVLTHHDSGETITCFTYSYEIGFGGQHAVQRWAVVIAQTPDIYWPYLCCYHRGLSQGINNRWDRLAHKPELKTENLTDSTCYRYDCDNPDETVDKLKTFVDESEEPCCLECHANVLSITAELKSFSVQAPRLLDHARRLIEQGRAHSPTCPAAP